MGYDLNIKLDYIGFVNFFFNKLNKFYLILFDYN